MLPNPIRGRCSANLSALAVVITCLSHATSGGTDAIPLAIRNRTGFDLSAAPARGGVPFARGVLRDVGEAKLLTAGGEELPCRVRATARWYDGSVKWLLVDTQVDLPRDGKIRPRLVPGAATPFGRPVTVDEAPDALTVDTGAARFRFSKTRFGLPDAAWADMDGDGRAETRVMTWAGRFVCEIERRPPGEPQEENWLRNAAGGARETFAPTPGDGYKAEVESANALRAVVKLSGWLVNAKGRKLIKYVIRVHAFRGRPELKLCPTFIFAGKPKEDFIRAMHLRFPRETEGEAVWALGGEGRNGGKLGEGVSLVSIGPEKIYHLAPYTRDKTVRYSIVRGGETVATGKEAAGWAAVGDRRGTLQAAVRNFWRMSPKELRVERDALTVYLWPERGGKVLDLRRRYDGVDNKRHYDLSWWKSGGEGVAVTHELLLRFGQAGEDKGAEMAARLNRPLLVECEPQYYADTLAFGPVSPANPAAYPRLEAMQTVGVEWMRRNQEAFHWDGMIDYGDTLFHGYETRSHYGYHAPKSWCSRGYVGWLNSEGALPRALFLHYLRSGDYETFLTAAEMTRHSMDVDVCHHCATQPRYVGGGHRHDQQHWGNGVRGYGADTQGIMDLYLLTGDERALDVARERVMYHDNGVPAEDHQQVGALYRFWEITGEARWRKRAAEELAKELRVPPDARWPFRTACHFRFVAPTSVSLMYYFSAASPEETAPLRDAILRAADSVSTWEARYAPYIMLALAYRISGDEKYINLLSGVLPRLRSPAGFKARTGFRAELRGQSFENMVKTARAWRINNIYSVLINRLVPLPYIVAALQKADVDDRKLFERKYVSPPPPPFEEKLDPKRMRPGRPIYGKPNLSYGYALTHGAPCDKVARSQLMLLEDGKPIKAHQAHALIRNEGLGRFSHWGAHGLVFSTSDNSDPRKNGREYKVVYPWPKP